MPALKVEEVQHPLQYAVITYTPHRRVEHFNDYTFAQRHADRHAPGFVYRADQVIDPDRGFLHKRDSAPVYQSARLHHANRNVPADPKQEENWL
jgi:hypothetical protein